MATAARCIRSQTWNRSLLRAPSARWKSQFSHIESTMKARKIQPVFDDLTPRPSYRLDMTLADFLPDSHPPHVLPPTSDPPLLPIPNHLIYFEPTKRASVMLSDGTNPDQSPGEPFVRRMWAGGRVMYNNDNSFELDGSRGVCAEFIRSVEVKGIPGSEKIFVSVERRLAKASDAELQILAHAVSNEHDREDLDHRVRQRLWRDIDSDFGPCSIVETRNIVFMRPRTKEQAVTDNAKARERVLTPQYTPDWTHTITPDPNLLFRFSALTFNAHAIHLDPEYAKDVEGYEERLFHGPLTYLFMTTLLQKELRKNSNEVIKSVEYRNLAPIYCNEPVTFCGAKSSKGGERKWEIWTQTSEGSVSAMGTATTEAGRIDRAKLGI